MYYLEKVKGRKKIEWSYPSIIVLDIVWLERLLGEQVYEISKKLKMGPYAIKGIEVKNNV